MSGTRAISTTWRRELSSSSFFLQGKSPKEIHTILTETLTYFLPGRAKDLSTPMYNISFEAFAVNNCAVGFCSDQSWKRGLHNKENAWRHHPMLGWWAMAQPQIMKRKYYTWTPHSEVLFPILMSLQEQNFKCYSLLRNTQNIAASWFWRCY